MKIKMRMTAISLLITSGSFAATGWTNCGSDPQAIAIQEVFWRSGITESNGAEYKLKSGQVFINVGALCRGGQVLKPNDWISELKKGLNPAKSVVSFQEVHSAEEFQQFLQTNAVTVNDQDKLTEMVTDYLQSKILSSESPTAMPSKASNPAIIVGSSKKDAVILLASSDGNNQAATVMQIKLK